VIDASARTAGLPFLPLAVRGDLAGFGSFGDFVVFAVFGALSDLERSRFLGSAMRGVYGVEPQVHRGELPEPPQ
jgi:hypothetical protein